MAPRIERALQVDLHGGVVAGGSDGQDLPQLLVLFVPLDTWMVHEQQIGRQGAISSRPAGGGEGELVVDSLGHAASACARAFTHDRAGVATPVPPGHAPRAPPGGRRQFLREGAKASGR
jgi:hypothetical protein